MSEDEFPIDENLQLILSIVQGHCPHARICNQKYFNWRITIILAVCFLRAAAFATKVFPWHDKPKASLFLAAPWCAGKTRTKRGGGDRGVSALRRA